VTVLAASGDDGATDFRSDARTLYHHRVNSWPSSDPLVTSVGGTQLHLDNKGMRTQADSVWNDRSFHGGASGGGRSSVFDRPHFQNSVQGVVGAHRGTPDISLNAASSSVVLGYTSFGGAPKGWHTFAGTSEATPLFAGIVALAIQRAGHRLGDINPALYGLAGAPAKGLVDVVGGSNSYAGVTGYKVTRGYDLGTGWGTIDAPLFVAALVAAVP
jgi:subtilase family serine protease